MPDTQQRQAAGNIVIAFVTQAMNPARYLTDRIAFSRVRDAVNEALVRNGLRVNDEGKVARTTSQDAG